MVILEGGFDQQTRRRLSFRERSTRRLVTVRFRSRRHASGTVCHLSSRRLHHCQYLSGDRKQSFSHAHTLPINAEQIFRTCRVKPAFIIVFVTWPWSSSEQNVSLMALRRSFIIIIIVICLVGHSMRVAAVQFRHIRVVQQVNPADNLSWAWWLTVNSSFGWILTYLRCVTGTSIQYLYSYTRYNNHKQIKLK